MSEFGKRLKQARLSKGLSQKELGDALNLTQASISQFEKGQRRPTPAIISKAATLLEVEREYLAGESEGDFERTLLMRNVQGLSPETVRKINEIVELIKQGEQQKK